jgi:hypothetical protein
MRKIILFLSIIYFISSLHKFTIAQKQGNIWYFGKGAGLDFNSEKPTVIYGGQTGSDVPSYDVQEGTTCVSDSSGNILFYTGGKTIWNRNNAPMPNGTNLLGGTSSTQSSLIVPLPGSNNIFYVFTTDEFQDYYSPNTSKGYRYSIVDMCLDKGYGDVEESNKNILLTDSSTEKLTACQDKSGKGYWVVGHKMFSKKFYSWHLTSDGIINTVITSIGIVHGRDYIHSQWNPGSAQGQMLLNASGTKLALAISNFEPAYLEIFDFDNNTGVLSNLCHIVIDSALGKRIYGVGFSFDDTKLYATLNGGTGGAFLYQFDMASGGGDCNSIKSSIIRISKLLPEHGMAGMQLGPDKKIYIITHNDLACINSPNLTGLAVNFDSLAITVGNAGGYMPPNFVAGYKYYNGLINCTGGVRDKNKNEDTFSIYPNPCFNETSIKLSKAVRNFDLEIYDAFGKKVEQISNLSGQTIKLQTDNLLNGIYLIRIVEYGKVYSTYKLLITNKTS